MDHIELKKIFLGIWTWYLEARSRYWDFGNICFEFSLECAFFCSHVCLLLDFLFICLTFIKLIFYSSFCSHVCLSVFLLPCVSSCQYFCLSVCLFLIHVCCLSFYSHVCLLAYLTVCNLVICLCRYFLTSMTVCLCQLLCHSVCHSKTGCTVQCTWILFSSVYLSCFLVFCLVVSLTWN